MIDPRCKEVPVLWRAPVVAWVESLRASGRAAETIRTRVDHVQRLARGVGGSPWVHGKGGRTRMVPLSEGLAGEVIGACRAGGGWAFPGEDGRHLSPRWLGTLVARELPEGWTLHTLRHRFATVAYAGSRDMFAVQDLLGHASPATTRRYVRLPDDALRRAAAHAAA